MEDSLQNMCLEALCKHSDTIPTSFFHACPPILAERLFQELIRHRVLSAASLTRFYGRQVRALCISEGGCGSRFSPLWLHPCRALCLEELDLQQCPAMDDLGVALLAASPSFPSFTLTSISMSGCREITTSGVALMSEFQSLQAVDLSFCEKITSAALDTLTALPRLRSLSLEGCDKISSSGFQCLRNCSSLRHLNLSGCSRLSDEAVLSIAALPQLTVLRLSGCRRLSEEGVAPLWRLTMLIHLDLSGCSLIRCTTLKAAQRQKRDSAVCRSPNATVSPSPTSISAGSTEFELVEPRTEVSQEAPNCNNRHELHLQQYTSPSDSDRNRTYSSTPSSSNTGPHTSLCSCPPPAWCQRRPTVLNQLVSSKSFEETPNRDRIPKCTACDWRFETICRAVLAKVPYEDMMVFLYGESGDDEAPRRKRNPRRRRSAGSGAPVKQKKHVMRSPCPKPPDKDPSSSDNVVRRVVYPKSRRRGPGSSASSTGSPSLSPSLSPSPSPSPISTSLSADGPCATVHSPELESRSAQKNELKKKKRLKHATTNECSPSHSTSESPQNSRPSSGPSSPAASLEPTASPSLPSRHTTMSPQASTSPARTGGPRPVLLFSDCDAGTGGSSSGCRFNTRAPSCTHIPSEQVPEPGITHVAIDLCDNSETSSVPVFCDLVDRQDRQRTCQQCFENKSTKPTVLDIVPPSSMLKPYQNVQHQHQRQQSYHSHQHSLQDSGDDASVRTHGTRTCRQMCEAGRRSASTGISCSGAEADTRRLSEGCRSPSPASPAHTLEPVHHTASRPPLPTEPEECFEAHSSPAAVPPFSEASPHRASRDCDSADDPNHTLARETAHVMPSLSRTPSTFRAACAQLRVIDLSDTAVGAAGVRALHVFEGTLQELYLTRCPHIRDDGVEAIAGIPSLRILHLRPDRGNVTCAAVASTLYRLPKLEELSLSGTGLGDIVLAALGLGVPRPNAVKEIMEHAKEDRGPCPCAGCSVMHAALAGEWEESDLFDGATWLQFLPTLSRSPAPPSNRRVTALRRLNVRGCVMTRVGWGYLFHAGGLLSLTHVDVSQCDHFDDTCAIHLSKSRKMDTLHLSGTSISATGLVDICRMPSLRVLQLTGCCHVDDVALNEAMSVTPLPPIEELSLADTAVSDDGVASLHRLASLAYLSLKGLPVTDVGLSPLKLLRNLHTLDLSKCTRLPAAAAHVLSTFPSLRSLNLSQCAAVSRFFVAALLPLAPTLQSLFLAGCRAADFAIPDTCRLADLDEIWQRVRDDTLGCPSRFDPNHSCDY